MGTNEEKSPYFRRRQDTTGDLGQRQENASLPQRVNPASEQTPPDFAASYLQMKKQHPITITKEEYLTRISDEGYQPKYGDKGEFFLEKDGVIIEVTFKKGDIASLQTAPEDPWTYPPIRRASQQLRLDQNLEQGTQTSIPPASRESDETYPSPLSSEPSSGSPHQELSYKRALFMRNPLLEPDKEFDYEEPPSTQFTRRASGAFEPRQGTRPLPRSTRELPRENTHYRSSSHSAARTSKKTRELTLPEAPPDLGRRLSLGQILQITAGAITGGLFENYALQPLAYPYRNAPGYINTTEVAEATRTSFLDYPLQLKPNQASWLPIELVKDEFRTAGALPIHRWLFGQPLSPALGTEQAFLDILQQYSVDPAFGLASIKLLNQYGLANNTQHLMEITHYSLGQIGGEPDRVGVIQNGTVVFTPIPNPKNEKAISDKNLGNFQAVLTQHNSNFEQVYARTNGDTREKQITDGYLLLARRIARYFPKTDAASSSTDPHMPVIRKLRDWINTSPQDPEGIQDFVNNVAQTIRGWYERTNII